MDLKIGTEVAGEYYAFEVVAAARKLVQDIMLTQPGEEVVISADTASDWRVVTATAQAVYAMGARPTVVLYETQPTAQMEPPAPVAGAVAAADVWIEYAVAYTLYTDARRRATQEGARYACMTGMDVDMMIRTIGRVNYPKMIELGDELVKLTRNAKEIRVTTQAGTDLVARMGGTSVEQSGGLGDKPGALVMLGGQVGWLPPEEGIHGKIVVDGTIWPPDEIGVPSNTVELTIEAGRIVEISGAGEAMKYEAWMASLGDPTMYRMAHYTYGFNPGVVSMTGRIVEDERLMGCMVFGFGGTATRKAATHTDCTMLNATVHLDGVEIERDGRYTHPSLARICKEMGLAGY